MTTTSHSLEQPVSVAARAPVPASVLGHVLVLSALAAGGFAAFVLVGLGGWTYYTTPAAVRGYSDVHRLLRPSGLDGHLFGIGGFILMLVPVIYSVRKKVRWLRYAGSMKTWLEVHIFCGIVGPVLVTFHTSFKFNGIVSVAYWSMVVVTVSGFVGRYLYVRIPRSLRGIELTRADLDARAEELREQLAEAALPESLVARVAEFERRVVPATDRSLALVGLLLGELRMRRALVGLRHEIEQAGMTPELLQTAVQLIAERAALLRRAAYLQRTKSLFDVWHVFHLPLVYVMFAIVLLHVIVTVYMGYLPFGQ